MNALTFFFLLAFSFLFGLLDAFYWPASASVIPTIVPKAELQRANSILQGSHTLFFIIGPILAGALIHHYSVGISFIVSALALILSALFVYPRFIQDPVAPGSIQSSNTVKVFREGMQYVKESPVHFWGMAVIAALHFFVLGPLINSFPILVTRLQGTALHLSYLEAGLGVGTFLGSLVIMIVARRQRGIRMMVTSLFGTAVLVILFSLIKSIPLLIVIAAAIGFAAMLSYLPLITFIQKQTEREKMGRVMSIITFASNGVEPLAFALIAILMTMGVSIHSLLLALGIGFFISAIIIVRRAKIFRQPTG